MDTKEHLIREASPEDISAVVASVSGLFAEDGARHDPHADPSWPEREGAEYYARLLSSPDGLVLLALTGQRPVGHLVGRLNGPDPLRPSVRGAELESMRVAPQVRGSGVGSELMRRFLAWAAEHDVNETRVRAFATNTGAQRFYQRWGFTHTHVDLARPLY
ncbi:GNAT family N-acetyltransferase [Nocardiopsis valliformis]|uniref:GNAT family N-acetyltransferase n=1 Tax=Nocardiopsis valliformis TaxID=239974 RepID=UPI0003486DBA|nr:GNAT family N-acetyltransferase [Nocardiopsis valliformis]